MMRAVGPCPGFHRAAITPWLIVLVAACVATGCFRYREDARSRQWPARVPAGGTVTFEGQPVDGATVVFVTQNGGRFYNAIGVTDSAGRFRLQTFRPQDGPVPGSHRVQIEKLSYTEKPLAVPAPDGLPASTRVEQSHLPAKYRSPQPSGLTAEVTAKGPNEFTFEIAKERLLGGDAKGDAAFFADAHIDKKCTPVHTATRITFMAIRIRFKADGASVGALPVLFLRWRRRRTAARSCSTG